MFTLSRSALSLRPRACAIAPRRAVHLTATVVRRSPHDSTGSSKPVPAHNEGPISKRGEVLKNAAKQVGEAVEGAAEKAASAVTGKKKDSGERAKEAGGGLMDWRNEEERLTDIGKAAGGMKRE